MGTMNALETCMKLVLSSITLGLPQITLFLPIGHSFTAWRSPVMQETLPQLNNAPPRMALTGTSSAPVLDLTLLLGPLLMVTH
jgi:hypothetical protein